MTTGPREARNGRPGCVVWLTGLSGAGKTTLAAALERELFNRGRQALVLDGDQLRRGLCSDLGFSHEDRTENVRRVGELARLIANAGIICITALVSPYRADRELARKLAPAGRFVEIFLNAPLEVCERRDPKGLYARARRGEISQFTGISAPYEPPEKPELELRTDVLGVAECVSAVLNQLNQASL